ncbi:hypothetical protein NC652_024212 [Populus alba x Populus x berolinensis]|nr:hypothetical protein NC652_024174 [Populus alba x Populus x berolinensis]KAJ6906729.1 hypothetical protein NC652_024212 [Populus alba x Populus x berolinensis]
MEGFTAEDLSTIGGIATVSLLHSFIPTHWLPFSIVGRAQKWTLSRTLLVTAFGAVLHVLSTSLLGITAITMANTIAGEETVHKLASLLLIILGGCYMILFLSGKGGHSHSHNQPMEKMAVAGLVLVPALSPCATTLPVFLAVGNSSSMMVLAIIVLLFSTITVMTSLVALSFYGASQLKFHWVERYDKLLVGSVLCLIMDLILDLTTDFHFRAKNPIAMVKIVVQASHLMSLARELTRNRACQAPNLNICFILYRLQAHSSGSLNTLTLSSSTAKMADRVYPRDDSPPQTTELKPPPPPQEEEDQAHHPQSPRKLAGPQSEKPVQPPAGTYVIQIPKDQVYRVPPPENAQRFERLSRRKPRRSHCCCCLCWFLSFLAAFLFLVGLAAAILYLVFRPESPDYSIERVSISGLNLTSSGPISPEFDVTVRANNPNNKIGIYYEKGSSVNVYNDGVKMAAGSLPVFYQDKNNVTVFVTSLKGSAIELTSGVRTALVNGVNKGTVPFNLVLRAPVKFKVGSVKTWKITVKVDCDLTVDKLTASAKIGSKSCDYGVDLW